MSAVLMRLRAGLRAGWRSALVLVLLIGTAGGAAIGAAAGARRTATAYDRYRSESVAHDVTIGAEGTALTSFADEIAALPQVRIAGLAAGLAVSPVDSRRAGGEMCCQAYVSDGVYGYSIDRPNVLEGRLPARDATTEALVNPAAAQALDLSPGDAFDVRVQIPGRRPGPTTRLTVTGVGVAANEIVPVTNFDTFPVLLLSPRFLGEILDPATVPFYVQTVRLHGDADAFAAAANRIAARHVRAPLFISSDDDRVARVTRSLAPLWVALTGFAGVVALTLMLVVGQLMARQLALDATDDAPMWALGMTRGDLVRLAAAKVLVIAAAGAVLAAGVAIAVSALMPIGPARLAEPHPGVEANLAILAGGAAIVVVVLLAGAAPAIRRAGRGGVRSSGAEVPFGRPSRAHRVISRLDLRPSIATGTGMALEPGHGRTAVPVRSTLLVGATALATVVVAFTFGANLGRFVATPELYGQRWDELWDATFNGIKIDDLAGNPDVEALSGGFYIPLEVEGRQVSGVGIEPLVGDALPVVFEGRAPAASDEIALGTRTLRAVGRSVGDTVSVSMGPGAETDMRVVGRAVFPRFGQGIFLPTGLGDGGLLTTHYGEDILGGSPEAGVYAFALVRYRDGRDDGPTAAALTSRCEAVNAAGDLCTVERGQVPADLTTYDRVRALPAILTGLLAAIAAASVGHALVSSVRRRRRDLAVLKAIGFTTRQVASAVGWQATTTILVALAFAIPLGVVGGRWAWIWLADTLGIPADVRIPLTTLAVTVPAAWALARVIALFPARAAARTNAASILRAE